jgi:glucose-6-phosphate isomerase
VLGLDIRAIRRGAASVYAPIRAGEKSAADIPVALGAALSTSAALENKAISVLMGYNDRLERFTRWWVQLWAESLGKEGVGQLPARALGATDQHSQLQLYRAGPRNAMVSLVRPRKRPELPIPDTDLEGLSYLADHDLGSVLDAEFEATEASLAAAGRPSVRVEIDRVDERSLGRLLYGTEAATVLAGELYGIETFTQPAVEWGKNAARGLLGADESEEAAAVREKERLVVD